MNEGHLRSLALRTIAQKETRLKLHVNGKVHAVTATPDTPLLYVLRDELHLRGPRFGCGLAQCGACTVQRDGTPIRSCVTPVIGVVGRKVTTLEGLHAQWAERKGITGSAADRALHPVQQAWIDEQVPAVRLLPERLADVLGRAARPQPAPDRRADPVGADGAQVPLRDAGRDPAAVKRASKAMA